jgi:predicted PurR-regulated permease PerM
LVGVVLAYTAIQTLEGFVITPRVVGKTVGLSEVWVLVALFVGGEIFGFLGVLLALPAAAVAKIFVAHAVQYYRTTELFLKASSEADPDRHPAGHKELSEARDAERNREVSPPSEGERGDR